MAELPGGTVTLLFTDIEGSTKLLQRAGDLYGDLLAEHRRLLRSAFERHGGVEVDTEGDAFFVAFASAKDAVAAAGEAQQALAAHSWPGEAEIRVRIGVHTGEPRLVEAGYVGIDVHRAARVMAAGHGGQVLISQSTRDLLDPSFTLRDLGEHRLKDLSEPQRLYQLQIDGLPSQFPSLRTLENRPTNLPVQATPLIGRESELDEVARLLQREDVRLLTLTGPGGTGKTRLALQGAADVLEGFSDGVFFVSLAPIRDPDLVLPAVARTLGLREHGGEPITETLKEYLRGREVLLALDNFEQVADAAAGLAALLSSTPRLKVLVTSRMPLHLAGEWCYEVPPLDLPESTAAGDLGSLARNEAVALFVERTQAASRDFRLTSGNATAVAEICCRLDGLPLALELAAARIPLLPAQALLRRLDQRLRVLTGGARDADERQQTLRRTIEWSYDLLAEAERVLFARLGVFVGGCTIEAAEAVCDPDCELGLDLLDGLASLVEKNLLRRREGPEGEPRFWLLETIREYALERLQEEETGEAVRARHGDYFLAVAEHSADDLLGPEQPVTLATLEAEYPNLRAALGRAVSSNQATLALGFVNALRYFWELHPRYSEAADWFTKALQLDAAASAVSRGRALIGAGRMAYWRGDFPESVALLEESLALLRHEDDPGELSASLRFLGAVLTQMGNDHQQAAAFLQEGVASARESGDAFALAAALYNRSFAETELGQLAEARRSLEEALQLARKLKAAQLIGSCLGLLGNVSRLQGDYDAAAAFLGESLASVADTGHTSWESLVVRHAGLLALSRGETQRAETLLKESLALAREQGLLVEIADGLHGLAGTAANSDPLRAARLGGAADRLYERMTMAPLAAHRQIRARDLEPAQKRIGDAAWNHAAAEGQAMTPHEAVEYALRNEGRAPDAGQVANELTSSH